MNSAVDVPTINRDSLVWIQAVRENFDPVSPEFLSRLRAGWFDYLSNKLGVEIPEYLINDDGLIERMRFIREVEIPIGGSNSSVTRTVATREFGDVYRVIGPLPQTANHDPSFLQAIW